MGKRKAVLLYGGVNLGVLALTLGWFWLRYRTSIPGFLALEPGTILALGACALGVNGIKLFRLYLILYGNGWNLSFLEHAKQYCKVLPVSVILPFKAGDLFRAYCYGYKMDSYGAGLVYILLDRFIDTCALVTMVLLAGGLYGAQGGWVLWLLLGFVGVVLFCYLAFPGICQYWRRFYLTRPASRRGLQALGTLQVISGLYERISQVLRGRGLVLYLLSLAAWLVEMGGVALLSKGAAQGVTSYLEGALTGGENPLQSQFVLASAVLLLVLYGILYLISWRKNHENPNGL